MAEELLYVLVGAVIGICGGFVAQYVHTKMWLNKDIEKAKSLLLSELNCMYKKLKSEEEYFTLFLKDSKREFDSICTLQIPTNEMLLNFDMVRLRFLTWETLISSGALFKLNENDMKILQTAQHNIRKHDSDLDNIRKQFKIKLDNHVARFGYTQSISEGHNILYSYFWECRNVVGRTLMIFNEDLIKLTWFDPAQTSKEECDVARYGLFSSYETTS